MLMVTIRVGQQKKTDIVLNNWKKQVTVLPGLKNAWKQIKTNSEIGCFHFRAQNLVITASISITMFSKTWVLWLKTFAISRIKIFLANKISFIVKYLLLSQNSPTF